MGGTIDWSAIPIIAEMFGVIDVESLIMQVVTIRTWQDEQNKETN